MSSICTETCVWQLMSTEGQHSELLDVQTCWKLKWKPPYSTRWKVHQTAAFKWEGVCCSKHVHVYALESKTVLDKCDSCSTLCFRGYPHKDREYRPPTKLFLTCRSRQLSAFIKKHTTFQHSIAVSSWVYYIHHLPQIGSPPCLTHSLPCTHECHVPG